MNPASFLLITLDYPPERGGVARYLGNLVAASEGAIDVLVPEEHTTDGPGRVQVRRMFSVGPWPWRRMISICRSVRAEGYTHLLVSHLLPVGTAAWIARHLGGVPYSVIIHGLDIRLAMQRPVRRWLAGKVLRGAAKVFANSEAVASDVRQFWSGCEVVVLTPGVEPRAFLARDEARKVLGCSPNERICLTVARLVPRKGIDSMIRVLARFPEWTYVVVGAGDDEARLRTLAQDYAPGRVQFVGALDDARRDQWYAAADLFVFLARSSSSDVEGFGIVALEAGLANLPVLAGRSGGVSEAVLDEETGVLVDPENDESISAAFHRLANDEALRTRLGQAGGERARREFAWHDRWTLLSQHLSSL
mgnify:CR=1 FL=1